MLEKSVKNSVIGFLLEANSALPRKPEIERVDMFPITSSLGDGPFRGVVSLPNPCSIIPYPSLKLFQHLLHFTRYLFQFSSHILKSTNPSVWNVFYILFYKKANVSFILFLFLKYFKTTNITLYPKQKQFF